MLIIPCNDNRTRSYVNDTWGYSRSSSQREYADRYRRLLEVVRPAPLLAGFCYTQFTDTYQEANGLLYMDRRPKFPLEEIALFTRGPRSNRDLQWESYWREQLMTTQRAQYVVPPEDRSTVAAGCGGQAVDFRIFKHHYNI